jgi:hypothetical protein
MKKTSTAIVLPATQPKPRKEDVLNALVERAREQHSKEAATMEEARQTALTACETEARKVLDAEISKLAPSFDLPWKHSTSKRVAITFRVSSPRLNKLVQDYNALPSMRNFDPVAVKKTLRERLAPSSERVDALLKNPDAVKALDAMLKELV